jgi:UrcA family protein
MTTMQDFTARIAGVFMLTLAAVPLAAGAASVAQAAPVAIRVADLDLNSARGAATFAQRADTAAREMCRVEGRSARLRDTSCEAVVKAEAAEKLAARQGQSMRASL